MNAGSLRLSTLITLWECRVRGIVPGVTPTDVGRIKRIGAQGWHKDNEDICPNLKGGNDREGGLSKLTFPTVFTNLGMIDN